MIPFTIAQNVKYLDVNLTKAYENFAEYCIVLMKEIKQDLNKWRVILGGFIQFNDILSKIPGRIFC